ncbi:hypothetical protein U1Q18_038934 [Sarracenia purpurea var. burkii]
MLVGFAEVTGVTTKSQTESFTRGGKSTDEDCSARFVDKRFGEARSCRSCRRTQRQRRAIFRIYWSPARCEAWVQPERENQRRHQRIFLYTSGADQREAERSNGIDFVFGAAKNTT